MAQRDHRELIIELIIETAIDLGKDGGDFCSLTVAERVRRQTGQCHPADVYRVLKVHRDFRRTDSLTWEMR